MKIQILIALLEVVSSLYLPPVDSMSAEACKQGASDTVNNNNQMLSRVFIEYGRMSDHVVHLPRLCLVQTQKPVRHLWSSGEDGPSILDSSVFMSPSYKDIKCPYESVDQEVIQYYAKELAKNKLLPVVCKNEKLNDDIAVGLVLIAVGYQVQAYKHYNKMLEKDKTCPALYYGRALAYAKSGITLKENGKHALNDFNTAMEYVDAERKALPILERRAEVHKAMGRNSDAINDYSRILRLDQSNWNVYLYRGTIHFLLEQYSSANDDFRKSLDINGDQVVTMHYVALCLYHMGRLREAISLFSDILTLKPDYTEVIQSLGQSYREIGDFDSALKNFNKALALNPADAGANEYKAHALYYHGDVTNALQSFRTCSSLQPFNEGCKFMKGASYATMGQYYPAIKEFTKVMLDYPVDPSKPSKEFTKVRYLREWSRYMHSNLENNLSELCAETNLSAEFRQFWVHSYPFQLQNYTEQPGIQPHIRDIETPVWDKMSSKKQQLLCKARHLGSLMDAKDTDGYYVNERGTTAMGLASLQISQSASAFFKSSKSYRSKHSRKMSWKDVFDIAVKWRRLVDVNEPIFWLDQLSTSKNDAGYSHHISFIRGDQYNPLYLVYLRQVVDLMKQLVLDFTNAIKTSRDYKNELENSGDYNSVMKTLMKYGKAQLGDPGFMLGTKVASVKERNRKHLDGFMVSMGSMDSNHTLLSIEIATKRARTQQYHAELDFIWDKIVDDAKKLGSNDDSSAIQDSLVNSILTLAYYFYNLMPISKESDSISYATAVGLLLAIGKEITGKIPQGKVVEMDALIQNSPEGFVSETKSWIHLKKLPNSMKSGFPEVVEILPTLRSCLEVLNLDLSKKCK